MWYIALGFYLTAGIITAAIIISPADDFPQDKTDWMAIAVIAVISIVIWPLLLYSMVKEDD